MGFAQIIEFKTSRFDEVKAIGDQWEAAAAGETKARRRILCKDRDAADRYLNIVLFDSYEEAMANSEHPVTQEYSQKMMAVVDGEPTFRNLEVLQDVSL